MPRTTEGLLRERIAERRFALSSLIANSPNAPVDVISEAKETLEIYDLAAAHLAQPEAAEPVDIVLYCPKCRVQHIDAPSNSGDTFEQWTNPTHRSHLCRTEDGGCGHIWRPSDHPTNGVAHTASGKDSDTAPAAAQPAQSAEPTLGEWPIRHLRSCPNWHDEFGRENTNEGKCNCALEQRQTIWDFQVHIGTLETLKAAWEKRAHQAENEPNNARSFGQDEEKS